MDSIRQRFLDAEDRFLQAISGGPEAVEKFNSFWSSLYRDAESVLQSSYVDDDLQSLIYNTAAIIQDLAEGWSHLETAHQALTSSMVDEVDIIISGVAVSDVYVSTSSTQCSREDFCEGDVESCDLTRNASQAAPSSSRSSFRQPPSVFISSSSEKIEEDFCQVGTKRNASRLDDILGMDEQPKRKRYRHERLPSPALSTVLDGRLDCSKTTALADSAYAPQQYKLWEPCSATPEVAHSSSIALDAGPAKRKRGSPEDEIPNVSKRRRGPRSSSPARVVSEPSAGVKPDTHSIDMDDWMLSYLRGAEFASTLAIGPADHVQVQIFDGWDEMNLMSLPEPSPLQIPALQEIFLPMDYPLEATLGPLPQSLPGLSDSPTTADPRDEVLGDFPSLVSPDSLHLGDMQGELESSASTGSLGTPSLLVRGDVQPELFPSSQSSPFTVAGEELLSSYQTNDNPAGPYVDYSAPPPSSSPPPSFLSTLAADGRVFELPGSNDWDLFGNPFESLKGTPPPSYDEALQGVSSLLLSSLDSELSSRLKQDKQLPSAGSNDPLVGCIASHAMACITGRRSSIAIS